MKIIIEIKDTATLSRTAELSTVLKGIGDGNIHTDDFVDVIAEIHKEW